MIHKRTETQEISTQGRQTNKKIREMEKINYSNIGQIKVKKIMEPRERFIGQKL